MADLISDLKLLCDLGLHCLHPFLRVSLTETVDYNEHFFSGTQIVYLVNKVQQITESQGSQYSHQPAQPSFMGNRLEVAGRTRITTTNLMGNFNIYSVFHVFLSANKHQFVGRLKLLH